MATEIDTRGMPKHHTPANESSGQTTYASHTAMERYRESSYRGLPFMPNAVADAKAKMDKAAKLVEELDEAAFDLFGEYHAAPKNAAKAAREAVAAGNVPESTAELDARLDDIARRYKDTVAHRRAVEAHLPALVDAYHAEAEKHLPEWRDAIAADLDKRAEPARVALAKALEEVRAVYGLAATVESLDRPRMQRGDRLRPSALSGRELPEAFHMETGGNHIASNGDRASFASDAEAAGRLATTWLKVYGRQQLGQGPIPEALTVPVSDLPPEDQERIARESHEREQVKLAMQRGMSERAAREWLRF